MAWLQEQQRQRHRPSLGAEPEAVSRLTFYNKPPEELVSIEEFEAFAVDRLKVLKAIEDDWARGLTPVQRQEKTRVLLRTHLSCATSAETLRKDLISHFILRLAYCRTAELRQWFLAHEGELFRCRFGLETISSQAAFMKLHEAELPYKQAQPSELAEVKPALVQVLNALAAREAAAELTRNPEADSYYQVPWEQVPDLVAMNKVFVKLGSAYVRRSELGSLVVTQFKAHLSRALTLTAARWNGHLELEEEDRLQPIVNGLSQRYLGPDFSGSDHAPKDLVTYSQLPALSKQSFPMCMQNMFDYVRREHELKHTGRQQLGLFLKGIGLPLEEALRFWRTEFGPKKPAEKFDKEYAYNIRHNYGKEGKRTDYTPYSCISIIKSAPGPNECHGCPYKTCSTDQIAARLQRMGVQGQAAAQITGKARDGHYQLACGLTFEAQHQSSCDTGINHPNQDCSRHMSCNGWRISSTCSMQYYLESRKVLAARTSPDQPSEGQQPQSAPQGTDSMQIG